MFNFLGEGTGLRYGEESQACFTFCTTGGREVEPETLPGSPANVLGIPAKVNRNWNQHRNGTLSAVSLPLERQVREHSSAYEY